MVIIYFTFIGVVLTNAVLVSNAGQIELTDATMGIFTDTRGGSRSTHFCAVLLTHTGVAVIFAIAGIFEIFANTAVFVSNA
jgi:hypothetical protein